MISFSIALSLSRFNFYHFGFCNINSINEMEIVRTKSLPEIKTWRDEMLVKILKVVMDG